MMKQFFMYPYNWVILLVGIALLLIAVFCLIRPGRRKSGDKPEKSLLDIAKERYARGEIDRKEYEKIKKGLE